VITEGAKSALAQIAASTIQPTAAEEDAELVAVAVEPEAAPVERPKKPRRKKSEPKAPRTEKDLLLDSVLNALPEPKAPGQGRGRRRVTTAALSGTPVSASPTTED
jgi:ribonuclease E